MKSCGKAVNHRSSRHETEMVKLLRFHRPPETACDRCYTICVQSCVRNCVWKNPDFPPWLATPKRKTPERSPFEESITYELFCRPKKVSPLLSTYCELFGQKDPGVGEGGKSRPMFSRSYRLKVRLPARQRAEKFAGGPPRQWQSTDPVG